MRSLSHLPQAFPQQLQSPGRLGATALGGFRAARTNRSRRPPRRSSVRGGDRTQRRCHPSHQLLAPQHGLVVDRKAYALNGGGVDGISSGRRDKAVQLGEGRGHLWNERRSALESAPTIKQEMRGRGAPSREAIETSRRTSQGPPDRAARTIASCSPPPMETTTTSPRRPALLLLLPPSSPPPRPPPVQAISRVR